MSIPNLMVCPTVWMEKTFFQIAENIRGEKIGNDPNSMTMRANLSLRVIALAHAVLQLAYAVFAVLPTCLAAAITVLTHPSITGFWSRERSVLAQVALAMIAAVGTVFMPVASSVQIACNLNELGKDGGGSIAASILAPSFLFSLTLPPLADLMSSCLAVSSQIDGKLTYPRDALEETDKDAYRWRLLLSFILMEEKKDDLPHFDELLTTSSSEFYKALTDSYKIAGVADDVPTKELLEKVWA